MSVITGTAEVKLLVRLGLASWDVAPDTHISPQGAPGSRLECQAFAPMAPEAWSVYAGPLVTGLTRSSRFAVLPGTQSLDDNQHRGNPAKCSCKGGPISTRSQGPRCGVWMPGGLLAGFTPLFVSAEASPEHSCYTPSLGPTRIRVSHDQTSIQMGFWI